MKERIWTKAQLEKLEKLKEKQGIPQCVIDEVERVVQILDCYYGKNRDVDNDDGGYVCLILSEDAEEVRREYHEILKQYNLDEDMAEFEDTICKGRDIEWHSDLFLVCNDYGVTIIYPLKREEE